MKGRVSVSGETRRADMKTPRPVETERPAATYRSYRSLTRLGLNDLLGSSRMVWPELVSLPEESRVQRSASPRCFLVAHLRRVGARVRTWGTTRPLRAARSRLVQGLGAHTDYSASHQIHQRSGHSAVWWLDYNKAQLQVLASVECVSGLMNTRRLKGGEALHAAFAKWDGPH